MSNHGIVKTRGRWFLRGMLVGMLLTAALNGLSFFAHSDGWGNLLGGYPPRHEAIGFPLVMWQHGNTYDGFYIDFLSLALNTLLGLGFGVITGLITLTQVPWLNRMVADMESKSLAAEQRRFQFSLRSLQLSTVLAAVIAAMARTLAARPETLAAIYIFGPVFLIVLAMLPRGISWEQRVAILTPAAIALIIVAVAIGVYLGTEFDKVILGIFVCWVPQCVLVALSLSTGLLFMQYRRYSAPVGASIPN